MKKSSSIISRSKAILIIILIVGAATEAAAYSYVNSLPYSSSIPQPGATGSPLPGATPSPTPMPSPAIFEVSNLTTAPFEVGAGEPVMISAVVTNIGDLAGDYLLTVTVNDVVAETKTVSLAGKESQIVSFNVTENNEGSFNVKIGDLIGVFLVRASPPQPMPTTLKLTNLFISPLEAWPDQNVNVSIDVTNSGNDNINYKLPILLDGAVAANINLQLLPNQKSTVTASINATSIGSHPVSVAGQNNVLRIVPTGKHTIHVWSDRDGFAFTFDGNPVTTPYNALVDVGPHTVVAPTTFVKAVSTWGAVVFTFTGWDDASTNPSRIVDVQDEDYAIAYYTRPGSCPSLYVWNGTGYTYAAEVNDGPGWLGYIDHFNADGSIEFAYNYPYENIKLDKNSLQPKEGNYLFNIGETSDEIFYLDTVKLVAVDHSTNVNVFSTLGTYIYNLTGQGTIYTVNKNLPGPLSAVNGSGHNVLPQISQMDGVFTSGARWQWNNLTLNLGDLSQAKEIKLIIAATINWPTTSSGGSNFMKYANQPGVTPSPPPYMEIKAANGSWVRVPANRQFPLPDVTNNAFVVNLTGLFSGNDYSIRINTYQDIRFDYIGVDTSPQQSISIQTLAPNFADLQQTLSTKSTSTGNFTRYGDVNALLLNADDKFVIGREGDSISLKFPANFTPVSQGMERDYFVFASAWFKGKGLPYMPFTVSPLPFQMMTSFPYPTNQSYPFDSEHLNYLSEYNTRAFTEANSTQPQYFPSPIQSDSQLVPKTSADDIGPSIMFNMSLATCAMIAAATVGLTVFRAKKKTIKTRF